MIYTVLYLNYSQMQNINSRRKLSIQIGMKRQCMTFQDPFYKDSKIHVGLSITKELVTV